MSEIWGAYFREGLFVREGGLLSKFYGIFYDFLVASV